MKVSYCSKTDIGVKYPVNSDSLGDKKTRNGHVFVVADGVPNDANGSFFSKLAVQSILEFFEKESFDNIYIGINHAFQFANEQLYRSSISNEQLRGAYVHLALVVVREEGAYYGHIGNAKICLKTESSLKQLTKDHGLLEIQSYKAGENPVSSQLTKALGNTPSVYPSVGNKPILGNAGEVILLATNGLFKSYTAVQLAAKIEYATINKNIIDIVDQAKAIGNAENLTLQLIAVVEGNDNHNQVSSTNKKVYVTQGPYELKQTEEEINEEGKKVLFNIAGMERKKMIKIGVAIVAFFLVIWYVFRQPQDDTDKVLDDAGEIIKADTTNQHQDLEDLMEYEKPKKSEEKEEEEVTEETIDEELNGTETPSEEVTTDPSSTDASTEETSKKEDVKPEADKKETKKEKSSKGSTTHVVKSGDNLGKIAEKYHVKMDVIRKANNLSNDQINIGQELKIPN